MYKLCSKNAIAVERLERKIQVVNRRHSVVGKFKKKYQKIKNFPAKCVQMKIANEDVQRKHTVVNFIIIKWWNKHPVYTGNICTIHKCITHNTIPTPVSSIFFYIKIFWCTFQRLKMLEHIMQFFFEFL